MIALLKFHSNDLAAHLTNVPETLLELMKEQWIFIFLDIFKNQLEQIIEHFRQFLHVVKLPN